MNEEERYFEYKFKTGFIAFYIILHNLSEHETLDFIRDTREG